MQEKPNKGTSGAAEKNTANVPRRRGRPRKNPLPEATFVKPADETRNDRTETTATAGETRGGRTLRKSPGETQTVISCRTDEEKPIRHSRAAAVRRTGVEQIPERLFTPSRATEIEAYPLPDFPLAHDEDDPAANATPQNNAISRTGVRKNAAAKRMTTHRATADELPENAQFLRTGVQKRMKNDGRTNEMFAPPASDGASSAYRNTTADRAENTTRTAKKATRTAKNASDGAKNERKGEKKRKSEKEETRQENDGLQGWIAGVNEFGNTLLGNGREHFQCISIIGQIEGHYLLPEGQKATKYEHIIPLLVSIEEDDNVDGLLVILNTMGGDVEAGLAIAEMIASMTKPTVSLVLGGGHSIGVPLATAARYSLIVPSATMTLHPVRVSGMVIGVPQSFRYMSEMQERITRFICAHSKANPDELRELMMRPDQIATDCGSILEGSEAVRYGIINEVGGLDRALEVLRGMIKKKE